MEGMSKLRLKLLEVGGPQYIIAARAGMAPARLSDYVMMRKDIPLHHLAGLCRVLECEPEDILGELTTEPLANEWVYDD